MPILVVSLPPRFFHCLHATDSPREWLICNTIHSQNVLMEQLQETPWVFAVNFGGAPANFPSTHRIPTCESIVVVLLYTRFIQHSATVAVYMLGATIRRFSGCLTHHVHPAACHGINGPPRAWAEAQFHSRGGVSRRKLVGPRTLTYVKRFIFLHLQGSMLVLGGHIHWLHVYK